MNLLEKKYQDVYRHFRKHSPEEIEAFPTNRWDDYFLLDIADMFFDKEDEERGRAVWKLILRSDDNMEDILYDELFRDIVLEHTVSEAPSAYDWSYRALIYELAYNKRQGVSEAWAYTWNVLIEWLLLWRKDLTAFQMTLRYLRYFPHISFSYSLLLSYPFNPTLYRKVAEIGLRFADPNWGEGEIEEMRRVIEEDESLAHTFLPALGEEEEHQIEKALAHAEQAMAHRQAAGKWPWEEQGYLPPVASLLSLGPEKDESVYKEILAHGEAIVPELLALMYDTRYLLLERGSETYGPVHAFALLRELSHVPGLAVLRPYLERADLTWPDDLWTQHLGKRGCYTTEEMENIATCPEYAIFIRRRSVEALLKRARRIPALRDRVQTLLKRLFADPQTPSIGDTQELLGGIVGELPDFPEYKSLYPEIRELFERQLIDPVFVHLQDIEKAWDLPLTEEKPPPPNTLTLPVQCTQCQGVTEVHAEHILVVENVPEIATGRYPREVIYGGYTCPFCGAVNKYQLSPLATFRLLSIQSSQRTPSGGAQEEQISFQYHPNVHPLSMMAFGRPMHPYRAIEEYRRRILAQPNNASLWQKLARVYMSVGQVEDALQTIEEAVKRKPDDPEILLERAYAFHELGRKEEAEADYHRAIELLRQQPASFQSMRLLQIATEGLQLLREGKPPPILRPWEITPSPQEKPMRHPAARKKRKKRKKKRK